MPRGGVFEGFQEGARILDTIERMKERKRIGEQRQREEENPEAHALETAGALEKILGGRDIEEEPELFQSLMRLKNIQPGSPQEQAVRGVVGRTRSLGRQARIRDFQQNLANSMDQLQQSEQRDQQILTFLKASKADPALTQMMEENIKQSKIQNFQSTLKNLKLGYGDIIDLPEVQQILQQMQVQGILGPTAPVPQGALPTGGPSRGRAPAPTAPRGLER